MMAGGQPDGDVGSEAVPVSGGGALSEAESAELQSLREEMADSRGQNYKGHWSTHYWHNEEKQAQFRELSMRQPGTPAAAADGQGLPAGDDSWRGTVDEVAAAYPDVVEAWGEDAPALVQRAQDTVHAVLAGVGDLETAEDLAASFDGLSADVQGKILHEIALLSPAYAKTATNAEIESFSETEEGAALVSEWRGKAAQNIGIIRQKIQRAHDAMTPAGRREFRTWYDGITAAERKAILNAIVR